MNIELTETETDVLKRIVAAKMEVKNDQLAHATSHACESFDPDLPPLFRIWEKINA